MKFSDAVHDLEEKLLKKIEPLHPILRNTVVTLVLFLLGLPGYLVANASINIDSAPSFGFWLDERIPFIPWTVAVYDWVYVIIFFPIFIVKDLDLIRHAAKAFLFGIFVSIFFFTVLPAKIERPVIPKPANFIDWWVWINYTIDRPTTLFPSMHVSNAILTAMTVLSFSKRAGYPILLLAVLISLSTLTMKQHFAADVIGGAVLAAVSYRIFLWPYVKETVSRRSEMLLPASYALIVPAGGLCATFVLYCIYRIVK
ncbi:MAG TPA: phosphatase PAP2 family protein [Leptospiraceae bacterium]|nr:phosphatase PAP2 family protein [Leptospiraceae bacterium]HMZ59876.1 phosphatase PAP2 family protein [Leptospiraceae bacterium]HNF26414.1 phosphatase PAP2 family protein [Leptospiraceae bacterium]HNH08144.1 phosphatase PAP2 family protein [Leptospiraceae bacterium]HNI26487.1 phosphatase PAP2 family protein [Leptospiraceae bacterium]